MRRQQTEKQFDPFVGIFVAQDQRPPHLEDVDLGVLTPFERALLVIDGTVTRFLETQALEAIAIVDNGRTKETLKKDHIWLELPKGDTVVSRRVLLQGKRTGKTYASAASLVVPERLKEAVGRPTHRVPEGLGRMLLNSRVEQFRELLWYGKEAPSDLPGEMRSLDSEYSLTRTYRIIVRGQPTMMITEWFEFAPR
jgi:chorismate-pyruvate lyase